MASIIRAKCHSIARTQHWIKVKNPKAPAVKREAEEEEDRR